MIVESQDTNKVQSNQGIKTTSTETLDSSEVDSQTGLGGDFEGVLKKLLTPNSENQTNEEELFAAVAEQRILSLKGDEAAASFHSALVGKLDSNRGANGASSYEDATRAALSQLVSDGVLESTEAQRIHAESFMAAQLDDNTETLFDGRGGANDPTVALDTMESALFKAQKMIEQIETGEIDPGLLSLNQPSSLALAAGATLNRKESTQEGDSDLAIDSNPIEQTDSTTEVIPDGNTVDGAEGFLFKPSSESDGNLVVLLQAQMTGEVSQVLLKDKDGNELEVGNYADVGNGGREHYRFSKPGSEYPSDLTVEVVLKDGNSQSYSIPDPSLRYD